MLAYYFKMCEINWHQSTNVCQYVVKIESNVLKNQYIFNYKSNIMPNKAQHLLTKHLLGRSFVQKQEDILSASGEALRFELRVQTLPLAHKILCTTRNL